MATGRKPVIAALVDYDNHRTKAELAAREAGEPKGCTADLIPPNTLSDGAREEWDRVVDLYSQLDSPVINDLDISILACYCESVSLYKAAQILMANNDLVVYNSKGDLVENPLIKIMDREGQNIAKYGEQLCLTPVGRARMGMVNSKKELDADPMTALLSRGKSG